jgi:hypothetical protein
VSGVAKVVALVFGQGLIALPLVLLVSRRCVKLLFFVLRVLWQVRRVGLGVSGVVLRPSSCGGFSFGCHAGFVCGLAQWAPMLGIESGVLTEGQARVL